MRTLMFCGVLLLMLPSLYAQIDYKGFPQWSWHKQDSTEYYLYTPSDLQKNNVYPVVLSLHGCCGENNHATPRNTVDPFVRMWHNFGANTQQISTYIIAPATSRGWKQHIPALKKVIDDLIKNHRADPQRVYITGFSMGGEGTWEFLQQYPNYFAAAITAGRNFIGDYKKIKDIPIWANRGETDYWANELHRQVAEIRKLSGYEKDSAYSYETGINPRFSSFKGYDHGVQWVAASTQDLVNWAYSKINDGNKYPSVWFESPANEQQITNGSRIDLKIKATDPDGSIEKVEININNRYFFTLDKAPYEASIITPPCDAVITATAYDNAGKTSMATTTIKSNIICKPVLLKNTKPSNYLKISQIINENGITLPLGLLYKGSLTHWDGDGEVTINNTAGYDGALYMPGINADTTKGEGNYLAFTTKQDIRILIAYERKDNLFTSGIPAWLTSWKKIPSKQIVAQYFYYDLYYKDFSAGKVTLPRGDRLNNKVDNNYFILITSP